MVVAVREQAEDVTAPKRKTSFMGRFRKNKSKSNKRDESPSPAPTDSSDEQLHVSREGVPIVTSTNASRFRASDVRPPKEERSKGHRNSVTDHVRVSAKQAAFAGPPRYDWIDIVSRPISIVDRCCCLVHAAGAALEAASRHFEAESRRAIF